MLFLPRCLTDVPYARVALDASVHGYGLAGKTKQIGLIALS